MRSRKIVARGSRIVVVIGQETVRGSQALVGDLSVQSNEVRDHFAEKGAGKPRTLKLINQVADDRMSLEDLLVVVARTRCGRILVRNDHQVNDWMLLLVGGMRNKQRLEIGG